MWRYVIFTLNRDCKDALLADPASYSFNLMVSSHSNLQQWVNQDLNRIEIESNICNWNLFNDEHSISSKTKKHGIKIV